MFDDHLFEDVPGIGFRSRPSLDAGFDLHIAAVFAGHFNAAVFALDAKALTPELDRRGAEFADALLMPPPGMVMGIALIVAARAAAPVPGLRGGIGVGATERRGHHDEGQNDEKGCETAHKAKLP